MKRIISLTLALCLCFALAACGTGSPEPTSAGAAYDSVIEITINPSARLFLDATQVIQNVECLNEDAEKIYENLKTGIVGLSLNDGLHMMLSVVQNSGKLTDESTIAINVVKAEQEDTVAKILTTATETTRDFLELYAPNAQLSLSKFGNELTEEELDTLLPDSGNDQTEPSDPTSQPTTQPTTAPTTKPTTKPTEAPEPVLPELIDMDAEYIGEVEYRTIVVKKSSKLEVWSMSFLTEEDGTGSYGVHVYTYEKGAGNGFTPTLEYKGNTYYEAGGTGGGWGTYSVEDNYLVLTGDDDEALKMKLGMTADKDLVVVSVTDGNGFYKVGTILEAIEY